MNLNSSLNSPFPIEQINDVDHDQHHQALNFGHPQLVSSSSSSTSASICHIFFNSTQDHTGLYHRQFYQPHHQEGDNYANYHGVGGSSYEIKNKAESGLESTLWKKEDQSVLEKENQVNWRWSSKMKMKNTSDRIAPTVNIATAKIEVEKAQQSASTFETDISSSHNSNTPIRVCSDCHTTKTPLWRSGPKGPKSLCNACGIRQRKARRAMAVAASGTTVISDQPPAMKIKVQYKEKMGKNGHSSQFKKRCSKMADAKATVAGSSLGSSGKKKKKRKKKLGFEDFLINLSNKLAFHRVFPQDEKDAAMLLMALSSGLVHG